MLWWNPALFSIAAKKPGLHGTIYGPNSSPCERSKAGVKLC